MKSGKKSRRKPAPIETDEVGLMFYHGVTGQTEESDRIFHAKSLPFRLVPVREVFVRSDSVQICSSTTRKL